MIDWAHIWTLLGGGFAAAVSGACAWYSSRQANKFTKEMEELRASLTKDIERLKADYGKEGKEHEVFFKFKHENITSAITELCSRLNALQRQCGIAPVALFGITSQQARSKMAHDIGDTAQSIFAYMGERFLFLPADIVAKSNAYVTHAVVFATLVQMQGDTSQPMSDRLKTMSDLVAEIMTMAQFRLNIAVDLQASTKGTA
jgi:hypothetical protein